MDIRCGAIRAARVSAIFAGYATLISANLGARALAAECIGHRGRETREQTCKAQAEWSANI